MLLHRVSELPVAFQDFPPEIIDEVFSHSLPDNSIDWKQPDVTIAPMLLCHVCSQWRTIALRSRRLWMRLYHVARFPWQVLKGRRLLREGIHSFDLEFLAWWRSNLGTNPLHLRFDISHEEEIYFRPKEELPEQEEFLINLFSLARHLELNWYAANAICESIKADHPTICPDLETLRIRNGVSAYHSHPRTFMPICSEHPIHKLHLHYFYLEERDVFKMPILSWSSLTHVVFSDARFSSGVWFDIICACVNLQSGYFKVYMYHPVVKFGNPTRFTHHHLHQLVIAWDWSHGPYLLKNMFLPSLTALRISPSLTTKQLHCILESTPALVELHLGWRVAVDDIWYSPSGDDDEAPDALSKYIPNLQYLIIQANFHIYREEPVTYLIENILTSRWLQLGEQTNNIHSLDIRLIRARPSTVKNFRRKLNDRLVINPIHGLKVAVMDDSEPLYWASSTSFDTIEPRYFEETEF